MTVKLHLDPQLEKTLQAEAAKVGLLLEAYMLQVLEKHLGDQRQKLEIPRPRRRPGSAKGLIRMTEDFDQPLEDFEAYR